jgi:hypothetical protein
MTRIAGIVVAIVGAAWLPLSAQQIKLPAHLESLSAAAEESVNVTLDGPLLRMAGRFLSDDADEAKVKKLLGGLQGIYVRSFDFAQEGAYSATDLAEIRSQIQGPEWSRIVGVKSKQSGANVDVYLKVAADGHLGGIVVLDAEPKELTLVNIVGTLDPQQLGELGGEFHIPMLEMEAGGSGQ